MDHPLSHRLNRVLSLWAGSPDEFLSSETLSKRVSWEFDECAECAAALLKDAQPTLRYGTLLLHLVRLADRDSVVRDVLTVGHIAKLLSRHKYFDREKDYALLGWPNRLFDSQSQKERREYFSQNTALPTSATLLTSPVLADLREAEEAILRRFGVFLTQ